VIAPVVVFKVRPEGRVPVAIAYVVGVEEGEVVLVVI
jgi:hypothetical protein